MPVSHRYNPGACTTSSNRAKAACLCADFSMALSQMQQPQKGNESADYADHVLVLERMAGGSCDGSIERCLHGVTVLLAQVKAEKSADSEEMRGMTAAAFSSAPSSSSPQPSRNPTGGPPHLFSPFQSQQQQQLLPSAQQPAMMELSGHSVPPSLHHHHNLEILGGRPCLNSDRLHPACQHCRQLCMPGTE